MCGLAGFIDRTGREKNRLEMIARDMTDSLMHRGPDDAGIWMDVDARVILGHRRLSIHDLSVAGRQPMHSPSGRYTIAFNGEIYNYLELKKELEKNGVNFRTATDTEVLLASIDSWGVRRALEKLVGMFAFSLWDKRERVLYLARDRVGEKPLYYGWVGHSLVFASELKAFHRHPDWEVDISRDSLAVYMRHMYVPSPRTIFTGIRKLLPGTILEIEQNCKPGDLPEPEQYWSARRIAEKGAATAFGFDDTEAVDRLQVLLRQTIHEKMASDVPLGAFLSGGIDSTTVVAIMQELSEKSVRTFTIGFNEKGYNEAEYAKSVARYLGTEHTELYITPREAMAVIPKLPTLYDEPFSDSSQIPTYLVSELTRKHVTVSLSGDGGDELFGGYHRYFVGGSLWRKLRVFPRPIRIILSRLIHAVPAEVWNRIAEKLSMVFPKELGEYRAGERLHKAADILGVTSPEQLYKDLISHWKNPEMLIIDGREPPTVLTDRSKWANVGGYVPWMMYMDLVSYLPDDILVKVDRASMGVSLEARVPFIDHRVIEFAWQLPMHMKVRDGEGKWILRQVLDRYVPRKMMERPKMGFGVPIEDWLKKDLRDWVEDLLSEERLRREGYLRPEPVRKKWEEHLSGRRNWQYYLWDVLMFQAWLQEQRA